MSEEGYVGKMEFPGIHQEADQRSRLDTDFPELMAFARDDETGIVYWPEFREFGIPVLDGGGSVMTIRFDPWTGRELPKSLRDELFDTLKAMGMEPDFMNIPADFSDERWWIERNL